MTTNASSEVERAEARVRELEAELADLPERVRAARRAEDVQGFLRATNRLEDVEQELPVARRLLAVARVRECEANLRAALAEDREHRRQLRAEMERAAAAAEEARAIAAREDRARLDAYAAMQSYGERSKAVAAELQELRAQAKTLGVAFRPEDIEGLEFRKSVILADPAGNEIQFMPGDAVPVWVTEQAGVDSHLFSDEPSSGELVKASANRGGSPAPSRITPGAEWVG